MTHPHLYSHALPPPPPPLHRISALFEQVLVLYCASLLERQQLSILPPYLCCVSSSFRDLLCKELLQQLTPGLTRAVAAPAPAPGSGGERVLALPSGLPLPKEADVACFQIYDSLSCWFRHCCSRQQQQQQARASPRGADPDAMVTEGDGPAPSCSSLRTSVRPDEMRLHLVSYTDKVRSGSTQECGPMQRACAARWLYYPYLQTSGLAPCSSPGEEWGPRPAPPAPSSSSAGPMTALPFLDGLQFACELSAEFSLGDEVTACAAHQLFIHVIPPGRHTQVYSTAHATLSGRRLHGQTAAELCISACAIVLLMRWGPDGATPRHSTSRHSTAQHSTSCDMTLT